MVVMAIEFYWIFFRGGGGGGGGAGDAISV